MTSEQRVWVAAILSIAILAIYTNLLEGKARAGAQTIRPENAQTQPMLQAAASPEALLLQPIHKEEVIIIESPYLVLKIGKQSAAVQTIQLRGVRDLSRDGELTFGNGTRYLLVPHVGENGQAWSFVSQTPSSATWSSREGDGTQHQVLVSLDEQRPVYLVTISASHAAQSTQQIPVSVLSTWARGDTVTGRYNMLQTVLFSKKQQGWQRTHLTYPGVQRQPKVVPRGTAMMTLSERYFCQSIKPGQERAADRAGTIFAGEEVPRAVERAAETTLLPSSGEAIAAELRTFMAVQAGIAETTFEVYVGPRDFFKMKEAGFEQAFPIGMLGQIGLGIILLLRGIASLVHNYGVAILLLSVIVTVALAPFTLISVRSMKKLQQLQPKMDQLKKKYDNDKTRLNQEMFVLFKQHKVSPASGCLPMLLQLPVFFAFWSAISHSVEFRGASFLWIKDLSLPDRLARLPFGFDLNILPLAMAAAMFFQTKMSRPSSSSAPGSNMFSGPMMSVIFGVMFYQVPSCLVLYWLTNSLLSLTINGTVRGGLATV